MTDAKAMLSEAAQNAYERGDLEDVLFADDTLLISRCGAHIEEYMTAVEQRGKDYGLQIHWGKVCFVPVRSRTPVRSPNGQ
eukprot:6119247-Karenia_brevis.AAC.1